MGGAPRATPAGLTAPNRPLGSKYVLAAAPRSGMIDGYETQGKGSP